MKSTLLLLLTLGCVLQIRAQTPEFYEIVLMGGRVMDPETGLDAVRNVGVRDDRIVEISEATLSGQQVIDVSGLVVAPGFIDLHSHGQTNRANEFQARDGVTTALELESGAPFLRHWLASRTGDAVLNFGATVDHSAVRWMAMKEYAVQAEGARRAKMRARWARQAEQGGLQEAADAGEDTGAVGALGVGLDAIDEAVRRVDVDAGVTIGQTTGWSGHGGKLATRTRHVDRDLS